MVLNSINFCLAGRASNLSTIETSMDLARLVSSLNACQ